MSFASFLGLPRGSPDHLGVVWRSPLHPHHRRKEWDAGRSALSPPPGESPLGLLQWPEVEGGAPDGGNREARAAPHPEADDGGGGGSASLGPLRLTCVWGASPCEKPSPVCVVSGLGKMSGLAAVCESRGVRQRSLCGPACREVGRCTDLWPDSGCCVRTVGHSAKMEEETLRGGARGRSIRPSSHRVSAGLARAPNHDANRGRLRNPTGWGARGHTDQTIFSSGGRRWATRTQPRCGGTVGLRIRPSQ